MDHWYNCSQKKPCLLTCDSFSLVNVCWNKKWVGGMGLYPETATKLSLVLNVPTIYLILECFCTLPQYFLLCFLIRPWLLQTAEKIYHLIKKKNWLPCDIEWMCIQSCIIFTSHYWTEQWFTLWSDHVSNSFLLSAKQPPPPYFLSMA